MLSWPLDPAVTYLNHGGFGGAPLTVLEEQSRLRSELEANPTAFMTRKLVPMVDAARGRLSGFVGADPAGLVFVANATAGVNAVLASFPLRAGDQVVVTDHGYNACRNALEAAAARSGAVVVVAPVPFPIGSSVQVVDSVLGAVTERTVLVMVDHVTSPTALVFPVQSLVVELESRGVRVLVDGAHAPGMVPLDVGSIGASFYTGNCHKWMCAPKGAGFLWVAPDQRDRVDPGAISHGWNGEYPGESRLHRLFDFTGTNDPTAWLSVPTAVDTMAAALPGGWQAVMDANRRLALAARDLLVDHLGIDPPAPDDMIGSMAAVPLPPGDDCLGRRLAERHRIEVPVFPWPRAPHRLIRVSAQLHNDISQYQRLAAVLPRG
jgi:isopenicillin-N epimerase